MFFSSIQNKSVKEALYAAGCETSLSTSPNIAIFDLHYYQNIKVNFVEKLLAGLRQFVYAKPFNTPLHHRTVVKRSLQ